MLKPRKQKKNTPVSNKKTLLRLLKGKVLQFDIEEGINYYFVKKGNRILFVINEYSINWKSFEELIRKLEAKNILLYAPFFCSTWVIANDKKALKKPHRMYLSKKYNQ
ncbi:hypothetical protein GNP80_08845 [Aliivibrio fischeri]|uniref:hypothetical protein n=1 Tax=Aliivibrio fischeri TaxID=668 RepID=UPI0012D8AF81|nr:hypothetical protein [Aliivibrio fischeri]MUK92548.1 hypothetical protein [Aliivibrio fischeri]